MAIAGWRRSAFQRFGDSPQRRRADTAAVPNRLHRVLTQSGSAHPVGLKVIHCTKHIRAARGRTLDAAGALFRERFRANCADATPRAEDWVHTQDWQDAENVKHETFAEAFWKKHPGMPFDP